ncbi:MAG TPA: thiamine diphosphokinase [Candidatus Limnocylindrales bacterium]|nr:thiamine diphosphokinase [Candidatus Limnocylindrales bacterium]
MVIRALILAGGTASGRSELDRAWPGWDASIELVIAADAGALLAEPLGLQLDLIVGDADSLGEARLAEFAAAGIAIERSPADKDASDTELALLAAATRGATDLVVLGAFGGRLDHALANVWILAHPELAGRAVALLDGAARIRLLTADPGDRSGSPAGLDLDGRPGNLVTLLPFDGPARGVTTSGLRWPLAAATLPAGFSRGLSNEVTVDSQQAPRVVLGGGRLLIIETTLIGSGT